MATPMVEDTSSFEEDQLASMSTEDITRATRLLDNEIRILKEDAQRTNLECDSYKEKIKENQEKIKLNKQLPYLVGNIVEILEMNPEDDAEEDGANIDLGSQRKGKCVVLKTSTRQTIFLPVVGLVDPDSLKPGDLVGVNKYSYLILDTLPSEYDSRVKAMEVDEKPTEDYNDIGGLEKQIQELVEAIVLPMTHKERFEKLGVRPPKGVLLYGPPGTGKTLMARACAAQTNATFLKLAGPQLVRSSLETEQSFEVSGDREVQRTMLELLNQLDGFSSDERIKVIAATNRADILDPALMRSGRLDRKIEFPHPTEEARARILQIHSRKMNVHPDVNFEELARSTDDFNGAQLKAVCVEAGMLALRRDATEVIVSSYSEINENEYLDPRTAQVAIVDHVKQICTKVRPANDEELPSLYIEEYRYALDAEIQRYVSESYPKGMSAVNCVKGKDTEGPGSDFELVVIITAMRLSPQNFCNGSWRSVWNIDFQDESQVLDIKGKLQVGAHYFEEGNVELDAKKDFQDSTIFQSADDCAIAIANIIRHHETEYLASLEVAYSKLPDNTFKDLRRKLPVTRTLFPWQNTLQFSLTREVEKELGLGK
ncbi:unnamed protein product [Arabidopsis thaliana]|uniref:(thale cress) hypothetical protein n=1 Tax=Arabidopsis thaliana TaxID=3702 RepID=A0A7G2EG37_ARATH|nr:unnamed protein product [Arabidopsis thaliana]